MALMAGRGERFMGLVTAGRLARMKSIVHDYGLFDGGAPY